MAEPGADGVAGVVRLDVEAFGFWFGVEGLEGLTRLPAPALMSVRESSLDVGLAREKLTTVPGNCCLASRVRRLRFSQTASRPDFVLWWRWTAGMAEADEGLLAELGWWGYGDWGEGIG